MTRSALRKHFAPRLYKFRDLQYTVFQEGQYWYRQQYKVWTISAPPGFGKSLVAVATAGHLLTKGVAQFDGVHRIFTKALIVVPALALMPNFFSIDRITIPKGWGKNSFSSYRLNVAKLVRNKNKTADSPSRDELEAFFNQAASGILVTSGQMLWMHRDLLPADMSNFFIYLDEAHHAPVDKEELGLVLEQWEKTNYTRMRTLTKNRGGLTAQGTATAWHTASGQRIYQPGDAVSYVGLWDLRPYDLVPEEISIERVMLNYDARTVKELLMEEETTQEVLDALDVVGHYWKDQKKPYTLFRFHDRKLLEPLKKLAKKYGARCLDVTGNYDKDLLEKERHVKRWRGRKYDWILSCRRFDEGTDLPLISNVFYFGAPWSARLQVQLLGRTLRVAERRAIEGYPVRWREKSAITFFIPRGSAAVEAYLKQHRREATIVAAYLEDPQIGQSIVEFFSPLRETFVDREVTDEEVHARQEFRRILGDEYTWAAARADLDDLIRSNISRTATLNEAKLTVVQDAIVKMYPTLKRQRLVLVFAERFGSQYPQAVEDLQREFEQHIDDAFIGKTKPPRSAELGLEDAMERVLQRWGHLHTIAPNPRYVRLISKFAGVSLEEVGRFLRAVTEPLPTPQEILRTLLAYYRRTGRWPDRNSGSCEKDGLPRYTFLQIDDNWAVWEFPEKTMRDFCLSVGAPSGRRSRRRKK